jgi:uncharacterized protein (DUF58 family)
MTIQRKRGVPFLALITVPLVFIFLITPIYVVQFIVLFLLLLLYGSKAYSEYLIGSIVVLRRDRELREFRYQWMTVELVAENRGRLPAFMIAVSDSPGMLPVFRDNRALFTLKARSRMVLQWQGYCSERGIFALGPATIRGADPLGLFPFSAASPDQTRLWVYPAPALTAIKPPGGIPLGALITPNPLYEDITRGRSLREYRDGDEPRRINWKASARVGNLMVNEYESTLSYPLMIFLNLNPYEYPLKKRENFMERAIETAAALCLMASRDRQEVGMIIYSPHGKEPISVTAPSSFALIPIMERLAALERSHGTGAEPEASLAAPLEAPSLSASPEAPSLSALPEAGGLASLRKSARTMLERGKSLPYGTRLVYTGPNLGDEDYRALNNLKAYHLSLEYLILDERSLTAAVPGNARRYQIKEQGYEIL